jgi:hypothetical protein
MATRGAVSIDYYHPPGYSPAEAHSTLAIAEERLRLLQDEERRNRTRSKLLEEEHAVKQQGLRSLGAQQDERRALLRGLDGDLAKKQLLLNKLSVEAEETAARLQPLEKEHAAKKAALAHLAAQQDEMRLALRKLEEEIRAKERAIVTLADHAAEATEKQKGITELLAQQRKLQGELDAARRELEDTTAKATAAATNAELVTAQVDRQRVQLEALEKEAQEKRGTLEELRGQLADARALLHDAAAKAQQAERDVARQRLEVQLAAEEAALRRAAAQELTVQHAALEGELEALRRAHRGLQDSEELVRENAELKDLVLTLKQELARSQLALEDKAYKAQSLETLLSAHRQRPDGGPLPSGAALTTVASNDPRQQLLTLLRRQEDRVARLQTDLVDQETKVRKAETHALQEQELREMVETELHVALAELELEKGKVAALARAGDLMETKVAGLQRELEKGRQQQLLTLMDQDSSGDAAVPAPSSSAPNTESIRRQEELLGQLHSPPPEAPGVSKGSSEVHPVSLKPTETEPEAEP